MCWEGEIVRPLENDIFSLDFTIIDYSFQSDDGVYMSLLTLILYFFMQYAFRYILYIKMRENVNYFGFW